MFRPELVIDKHSGPVYACVYDQNQWIYSSAGDKFVTRWNVATGEQDAFAIKSEHAAYALHLWQNLLFVGTNTGEIHAVDVTTKKLGWQHNFHGNCIFSLHVHGNLLLAGDESGNLMVIEPDGKLLATFPLNCGKIRTIYPFSNCVAIGCQDGKIRFFSWPELNELSAVSMHDGGVNTIVSAGNLLYSGGKDGRLTVSDSLTGQRLESLPAHYQTIYGLIQLTPELLVTASRDKTIKIWNSDLKVVQRIEQKSGGHRLSVNGVCKISDQSFVTWSDDKRIILWAGH